MNIAISYTNISFLELIKIKKLQKTIDESTAVANIYPTHYTQDRDFYPEGERGDRLFSSLAGTYHQNYKDIIMSSNLESKSNPDTTMYFSYYKKDVNTIQDITNRTYNSLPMADDRKEFDIEITVDNQKIKGKAIEFTYFPPSKSPNSEECFGGKCIEKSYRVIFEYDNFIVSMFQGANGKHRIDLNKEKFVSKDIEQNEDYFIETFKRGLNM